MEKPVSYRFDPPLDLDPAHWPAVPEFVPPARKVPHGTEQNPCYCDECWNAGVRLMDREKQKRLDNL